MLVFIVSKLTTDKLDKLHGTFHVLQGILEHFKRPATAVGHPFRNELIPCREATDGSLILKVMLIRFSIF